jgi:SPP1 gp7 family putative phage head morphogenesis protein
LINLFKEDDPRKPSTEQVLTKTLDYNAGLESELENPDSLLENKSKDLTFYDTLLNDDKIKSSIELKKRLTLSSNGDVISASEETQDQDIADFCRWQFENMFVDFYDILDNYLDGMVYGFKVGELMWINEAIATEKGILVPDQFKGKWWVGNIKHKHSVFFDFEYDEYGNVKALLIGRNYGFDTSEGGKNYIDAEEIKQKFLIFIYPYAKDGNYYGDSDLKEVYTQWFAKFNIFRFRNMYLEKFGMPIPEVIYNSQKTNATEVSELKAMLKNFQDSMYFVNPGAWNSDAKELVGKFKIILHEVRNGNATDQYEKAIDQIDKQIARKLLIPDKLGFSETTTGSYSLGEVQYGIFVNVIEDLQRKLENVVNNLIKKIVDVNYSNIKDYPTWQFDKLSKTVKQEMLKILIEKGVIDKREKWIRKYVGIPELSEKEKEEIEKEKEEAIKNAPPIPQFQPQFQPQQQPQQPPQKKKEFKVNTHPVNFKKIERFYDESEADFLKEYSRLWIENTQYLIGQTEKKKIVETKNIALTSTLRIKKAGFKRLFQDYYLRLYIGGKIDGIEEIDERWKKIKKEGFKSDIVEMQLQEIADRDWVNTMLRKYAELGRLTKDDIEAFKLIKQQAFLNAGNTEVEMVETVQRTITEGIRNNKTTASIINEIERNMVDKYKKYSITVARTGASDYYNTGRMNLFNSNQVSPYIEAYQYIAIIDSATTDFCASHDGQIIQKGSPELSTINPPNHFNCRSLLTTIFLGENNDPDSYYYNYEKNKEMKPWGTGVKVDSRQPVKGFGG